MVIYKVKRRIYGNAHCCYLPSNRQVISPRSVALLWGTGIVSVDPGVIGDLGQLELDSPSRSEGMEPIFLGVGVCGSMRFSKKYSGNSCCPRSIGTTWDIDGREFGDSAVHSSAILNSLIASSPLTSPFNLGSTNCSRIWSSLVSKASLYKSRTCVVKLQPTVNYFIPANKDTQSRITKTTRS